MTDREEGRRPSEERTDSGEDDRYGWYVEKLLDLLDLF